MVKTKKNNRKGVKKHAHINSSDNDNIFYCSFDHLDHNHRPTKPKPISSTYEEEKKIGRQYNWIRFFFSSSYLIL
ncbi:hypothetical protein DERF_001470 [Dermatophagoides farinae]|uniref:Uncharacterized protein n=1 Tax=Dermatophagoides farinae TaxID=6954 RepID=A0A922IAX6_DERFA|nr:hypothetical protein DERF_001470 [Dermatophagoides farinae]